MEIFKKKAAVEAFLKSAKSANKKLVLVPTMGALHSGHIALVTEAKTHGTVVGVSIFVNPTQFNDKKDFQRYPRTLDKDVELLAQEGCDFIFAPDEIEEVFPSDYTHFDIEFGGIENVLEGFYRPDHFKGVANVVFQLFDVIKPDAAIFGLKDYQQFLVIKEMVRQKQLPIEIIGSTTKRNDFGLALSSRNQLLTDDEKRDASLLNKSLQKAKDMYSTFSVDQIRQTVLNDFEKHPQFRLQYFEIADAQDLTPITTVSQSNGDKAVALIAAFLGNVRLIDNDFLNN